MTLDDCFQCKVEEEGVVGATLTDDNTAIEQSGKPTYHTVCPEEYFRFPFSKTNILSHHLRYRLQDS